MGRTYHTETNNRPIVFVLNSSSSFGKRLLNPNSSELSNGIIKRGEVLERRFPDGEPYVLPGENVRGRDVYVIQSLYTHPREEETMEQKLVKLLMFCDAADGASAERVTAVIPYLAFSRQDRKTESRAPLSARMLAKQLEAANVTRIMAMDVHSPPIQSAYRVHTDFLLPFRNFADFIVQEEGLHDHLKLAIIAPDSGAMDRVEALKKKISSCLGEQKDIITGYADKRRVSGTEVVSYELMVTGDLEGVLTIIPDDETVTGGTILNVANKAKERGAGRTVAFVTHGKMTGEAAKRIQDHESIDKFFITDTIFLLEGP